MSHLARNGIDVAPKKREPARARKARRVLESTIENAAIAHAKERGWVARKMNGLGFRSWPDRLFLPPKKRGPTARVFWVEFKRPGEAATPDQARVHDDLRARGQIVHVVDSIDLFVAQFAYYHEGKS